MKILVVINHLKPHTMVMAEKIAAYFEKSGVETFIDNGSKDIKHEQIDLIIVLGGDGTLIRATRQYGENGIPILGVNMGTVGFLSNIKADELEAHLHQLVTHDYSSETRMMLEVEIYKNDILIHRDFALNEICIKSKNSRMINIDIHIAGSEFACCRGDGIIIATPTGSTAYSLSSGGPIVDPKLEVFIMTPISSFLLNQKPMVIAAEKEIELLPLRCKDSLISIDGQVDIDCDDNYVIKVNKSQHKLTMVNLKRNSFFQTIITRLQRNFGG